MVEKCDVLVAGTGAFAARVVFDLAVGAEKPLKVAIGGRNPERMDWLRTAADARAADNTLVLPAPAAARAPAPAPAPAACVACGAPARTHCGRCR